MTASRNYVFDYVAQRAGRVCRSSGLNGEKRKYKWLLVKSI